MQRNSNSCVLKNLAKFIFAFFDFVTDSIVDSLSPPARVSGREFRLRFSDGSEITVTP